MGDLGVDVQTVLALVPAAGGEPPPGRRGPGSSGRGGGRGVLRILLPAPELVAALPLRDEARLSSSERSGSSGVVVSFQYSPLTPLKIYICTNVYSAFPFVFIHLKFARDCLK